MARINYYKMNKLNNWSLITRTYKRKKINLNKN